MKEGRKDEIEFTCPRDMLGQVVEDERTVKVEIKERSLKEGIEDARLAGMPEYLIEKVKKFTDDEDTQLGWFDEYGFLGICIKAYTVRQIAHVDIPFGKVKVIIPENANEIMRNYLKDIISMVNKEAVIWTAIPYPVRQEMAAVSKAEAYDSLRRLKDDC